ncbi:CAP domain-containing protein [Streptomyces sp. NPDC026672]|uniref:CAP domain-containing protein n=1 Tax=unclassified Streptomyces TaxID=2593676 RepID=UPI0033F80DC0
MGRHRRAAAGTQDGPATLGIAPYLNPDAYADADTRSAAYLYAADDPYAPAHEYGQVTETVAFPAQGFASDRFPADTYASDRVVSHGYPDDRFTRDLPGGERFDDGFTPGRFATDGFADDGFAGDDFSPDGGARGRGHRRKKKAATPVRTGLLGVSAAVAIGTVAVATGVVPGLENYRLGGGTGTSGGESVQAAGVPTNSATEQGGTSGSADAGERGTSGGTASRDGGRSVSPAPSAPAASTAPAPTETPSPKPKKPKPTTPPGRQKAEPKPTPTKGSEETSAPATVSTEAAAAAEVVRLVNEERAKVGCSAVSANSSLGSLAAAFSEDMAARGFFDHTDPDGASPWDRAAVAGITDLGGENIARGQADAAAVMDAWMNSPGHRANILNCDFTTLGVGVHFGEGGPWWTQDFGY